MIRYILYFSFLVSVTTVIVSCDKTDDNEMMDAEANLSVEAYVYVNEPVRFIKLHKMSGKNSLSPQPVSEAHIELWQNDELYHFHAVDGNPGMYTQTDTAFHINADAPLYLNITNGKNDYRLKTNIPPIIKDLSMDVTDITLDLDNPDEVLATLSWQPVDGYNYCIFIRNNGHDIFPVPDPESTHAHSAFYSLITENRIELKSSDFTYHGQYNVYVTAVDMAYANFYNNPANIAQLTELNSGLPTWGVFTAFNGSSIHVHVN
jgi:hypothetical protein